MRLGLGAEWLGLLLLLGVSAGARGAAAAAANPQAEELLKAINAEYKFNRTSWDSSILNDAPSNLKLERILWTAQPRRFEFTVFTQLTLNRLPTLFNMCSSYTGPLSAAVYLALVQPDAQGGGALSSSNEAKVAEAVLQAESFFHRVESNGSICQLDLMLFSEVFDSDQAKLLYPVNYLRNYARMQVRTRLLAMIDVDMFMSTSLSQEMSQPASIQRYEELCAERRATVLPAFEPTKPGAVGKDMAMRISRVSKSELQTIHGRNKVTIQFKLRVFPRGHTPTDYLRWFATSEPYQVTYKRFYEPWFITCNEIMPWYDIEFRGYGMNKIVLIAALNYYNYTFWIHPSAWLVHNPHTDTDVRKMVARQASDVNKFKVKLQPNALYRKLTLLFGKAKRGMMRGTYDPKVDPRQLAVYDKVAWLRAPPQLVGSPTPESVFV
ncbi:Glycosyltransferase-like protein LARGE [Tetrabaena socialis]|uniref:Glycosyltransferase-like protein LARGE n=1 Tax=Tetrabaena socialis TaxID=47790 RepID=A0A2J8AI73_9CHLO|nr:Glycosyltransferase-like protein LARGE [Tetrabaena socialis]|eukprot:PNH12214.1 Glycosyltransferase-like protein LARGE [Tetrabaena socialis]